LREGKWSTRNLLGDKERGKEETERKGKGSLEFAKKGERETKSPRREIRGADR